MPVAILGSMPTFGRFPPIPNVSYGRFSTARNIPSIAGGFLQGARSRRSVTGYPETGH
jgi:hypothetical protein